MIKYNSSNFKLFNQELDSCFLPSARALTTRPDGSWCVNPSHPNPKFQLDHQHPGSRNPKHKIEKTKSLSHELQIQVTLMRNLNRTFTTAIPITETKSTKSSNPNPYPTSSTVLRMRIWNEHSATIPPEKKLEFRSPSETINPQNLP